MVVTQTILAQCEGWGWIGDSSSPVTCPSTSSSPLPSAQGLKPLILPSFKGFLKSPQVILHMGDIPAQGERSRSIPGVPTVKPCPLQTKQQPRAEPGAEKWKYTEITKHILNEWSWGEALLLELYPDSFWLHSSWNGNQALRENTNGSESLKLTLLVGFLVQNPGGHVPRCPPTATTTVIPAPSPSSHGLQMGEKPIWNLGSPSVEAGYGFGIGMPVGWTCRGQGGTRGVLSPIHPPWLGCVPW